MLKQVKVEFISEGWSPPGEIYHENGIVFDNDMVLVVDDIGGVSIYNLVEMKGEDVAIVADFESLECDRDLLINLILNHGGGAK